MMSTCASPESELRDSAEFIGVIGLLQVLLEALSLTAVVEIPRLQIRDRLQPKVDSIHLLASNDLQSLSQRRLPESYFFRIS